MVFYVYKFFKVWNCSRAEADIRVHEFFETIYFKKGIQPIPDPSRMSLRNTHWSGLEHYPGLLQEIHFGNHFYLHGKSRPKSEICRSLGAQVLIDDNPRYALECVEIGINDLLFDYHNSYPWSKCSTYHTSRCPLAKILVPMPPSHPTRNDEITNFAYFFSLCVKVSLARGLQFDKISKATTFQYLKLLCDQYGNACVQRRHQKVCPFGEILFLRVQPMIAGMPFWCM